jgi:hypothetical protein
VSTDFGPACGYTLLDRNAEGWLQPTPAYLAAWLARPELALVPESCRAETRLHEALQRDLLRPVPPAELAGPKGADERENCTLPGPARRAHAGRHAGRLAARAVAQRQRPRAAAVHRPWPRTWWCRSWTSRSASTATR